MRISKIILLAVALFVALGGVALAASSANYRLPSMVLSSAGGQGISTSYRVVGTVGQPAIGALTSTNYKLKASDGSTVGTYSVGDGPMGICYDSANIWVANYRGNTVTKLKASDGSTVGTYSVGNSPFGICFDGANIWVTNATGDTVTKL